MKAITSLLIALLATPTAAQSVAGVRFGDALEEVRGNYGGNYAPIHGTPGASFLTRPDGFIWFCHERVTSMQERVGRDLHVFTDLVVENTVNYGEPEWLARNVQTTSGEISTLEAKWSMDGYDLSIGYVYAGAGLDVTRTYTMPDTCAAAD